MIWSRSSGFVSSFSYPGPDFLISCFSPSFWESHHTLSLSERSNECRSKGICCMEMGLFFFTTWVFLIQLISWYWITFTVQVYFSSHISLILSYYINPLSLSLSLSLSPLSYNLFLLFVLLHKKDLLYMVCEWGGGTVCIWETNGALILNYFFCLFLVWLDGLIHVYSLFFIFSITYYWLIITQVFWASEWLICIYPLFLVFSLSLWFDSFVCHY